MWKISALGASLMRMPEDNGGLAHSRYRALLDVSAAMGEQPTVKAVLHSLRDVLSSSVRLHGTDLYLLDSGQQTLHLLEFDREADAPAIRIGTKISRIGAAAQALEQQKPVFLPDISQEMLKHPELAPFAAQSVGRTAYIFSVSTSQQKYGLLVATKERGQEFVREDVELVRSLTSHVAIALECALGLCRTISAGTCYRARPPSVTSRNQQSRRFKTEYGRSFSIGFNFDSFVFRQSSDGILASRKGSRDPMLHTLGTYLHLPRIWYTVPEGIMQNSKAEKLRKLASKRQIVRAKDAREFGIPRTYLPRLARQGDLEKVGRGLYSSRDFSGTENTSLIEAAYQIPKGIVCLLSALRFHNFTTQSPHEVWMAIGHKAWAPKISSPPVRLMRMSGPALHFGMKEYSISGATLRVFSPAKSVADCFKFRSKVGLDVAIEALKECRQQKKASIDELAAAAKVCRVANVMRPYMESL